jgi:hypothetical protein
MLARVKNKEKNDGMGKDASEQDAGLLPGGWVASCYEEDHALS